VLKIDVLVIRSFDVFVDICYWGFVSVIVPVCRGGPCA
jgi:hypothetical protein